MSCNVEGKVVVIAGASTDRARRRPGFFPSTVTAGPRTGSTARQEGDMGVKRLLVLGASVLMLALCGRAHAGERQVPYVQIAELEIDPTQLEAYKAAAREQIETAIRAEPGVLALYSVSRKDDPAHITVFEIYADTDAYEAHLEAAHFKKYKMTTDKMVKSLKLIKTDPVMLGAKAR